MPRPPWRQGHSDDGYMTDAEFEAVDAVDKWRQRTHQIPSVLDIVRVMKEIGYVKHVHRVGCNCFYCRSLRERAKLESVVP